MIMPKEVHEYKIKSLEESISRQIDDIVEDLISTKEYIQRGRSSEGIFPKNNIMDLAIRLGQLSAMRDVEFPDQEKEERNKTPMNFWVNYKGYVPGCIPVDSLEEAEQVFSTLVASQNIPGADRLNIAILKTKDGETIKKWEFDNYF